MNESLALYSGILLLGTLIASISQAVLKKAASKEYPSVAAQYLNFPVIFAYTLFFLTTLMSVFAYKVVPLSLGPVLESTSYLYVTVIGAVFFGERVTKKKLAALSLIMAGIAVYALGV